MDADSLMASWSVGILSSLVLVARRGCPMNDYIDAPDIPLQVALIIFVTLWGALTCVAALRLSALG
jgi:hypothetical protein